MEITKQQLIQKVKQFSEEMILAIENSGGMLYPDEVVDAAITVLLKDGTWNEKVLKTLERLHSGTKTKGEAFNTLARGNSHAQEIIKKIMLDLENGEPLHYVFQESAVENETKETEPEIPDTPKPKQKTLTKAKAETKRTRARK